MIAAITGAPSAMVKAIKRWHLEFQIDTLAQRIDTHQLAIDAARYRQRMARGRLAVLKHALAVL